MQKVILKSLSIAAVAAALTLPMGNQAHAQQCGQERKVGASALDEITYRRLNDIAEKVGEENYNEAYNDLQTLLGRSGKDTYLQAIIHMNLAQVEWARERFDPALRSFEKAVELNALPNQQHFSLMYQIAQLYNLKERYREALQRLDLWFCTVPPEKITSAAYVLKASIYAQMSNFAETLKAIEQAIDMDSDPKEPWYQLKLASHYELEQFPQAAQTLETMIQKWSEKKDYWVQLAQIYLKLKQDKKALAVQGLAYRKNLLDKQTDVVFLSNLYSNSDVPYKAAEVLEKGITDGVVEGSKRYWSAVADSWYAAEELEKALSAYQKAGRASSDGKIDLRRGYILIDLERWPEANEAVVAALEKGGLDERKTGEAYLLKGMSEFNLGNFEQASVDWGRATRYPRSKDAAQQWLNHLREERARRAP